MRENMKKVLCCFVVLVILMSVLPFFVTQTNAIMPVDMYMGKITGKNNDVLTVQIEYKLDYSNPHNWVSYSATSQWTISNSNAINEIRVGDYIEIAGFLGVDNEGESIGIGKMKSSTEKVITDVYGDPGYLVPVHAFIEHPGVLNPPLLGDYIITYENIPDCSKCPSGSFGCNVEAKYSDVTISKGNEQLKSQRLYPSQNYGYADEEYKVDITFNSGEAPACPDCTDQPCFGPQAFSDFTIHIIESYKEVKFRGKVLVNRPIISFYSVDVKIDEILNDPTGKLRVGDVVTAWSHRDSPAKIEDPAVGDRVEVFGKYFGHDVRAGVESDYIDLETASHYLKIEKKPDLIIQSISCDKGSPKQGDTITFNVKTKNKGLGNADGFFVYYYMDDNYKDHDYVSGLDVGETKITYFSWTANKCGNVQVKAVADATDAVDEGSNEGNNERTETVSVTCQDQPITSIVIEGRSIGCEDYAPLNVFFRGSEIPLKLQGLDKQEYTFVGERWVDRNSNLNIETVDELVEVSDFCITTNKDEFTMKIPENIPIGLYRLKIKGTVHVSIYFWVIYSATNRGLSEEDIQNYWKDEFTGGRVGFRPEVKTSHHKASLMICMASAASYLEYDDPDEPEHYTLGNFHFWLDKHLKPVSSAVPPSDILSYATRIIEGDKPNADCDCFATFGVSLARAAGIPARAIHGLGIESSLDLFWSHCWVEPYYYTAWQVWDPPDKVRFEQGDFLHYNHYVGYIHYQLNKGNLVYLLTAREELGKWRSSDYGGNPLLVVLLSCPVHATITDQYGRIVSDDGTNEIPDADMIITNGTKIFYLPADLTYSVDIDAYDTGTFNFTRVSPIGNDTSITKFENIQVTSNTKASVELESGVTDYTMSIDYNGDGVTDEERAPDERNGEGKGIPDLTISDYSWTPENPKVGDNVKFTVTVTNIGNGYLLPTSALAFGIEKYQNECPTNEWPINEGFDVPILKPGESKTFTEHYTFKKPGTYLFFARAITDSEKNKFDQVKEYFEVSGVSNKPDLIIEAVYGRPINPTVKDSVQFRAVVRNQGEACANSSTVKMNIVGKGVINSIYFSVPAIPPSVAKPVKSDPQKLKSGDYRITAIADAYEEIEESDESNNERTRTFHVARKKSKKLPDLQIPSVKVEPNPFYDANHITLTFVIANRGDVDTLFNYGIYFNGQHSVTTSMYWESLKAGESREFSEGYYYPVEGTFKVCADYNNDIKESDERNNCASVYLKAN